MKGRVSASATSPLQSARLTVSQPESPVANHSTAQLQQTQVKAAAGDRPQPTTSGFKQLLAALLAVEPLIQ